MIAIDSYVLGSITLLRAAVLTASLSFGSCAPADCTKTSTVDSPTGRFTATITRMRSCAVSVNTGHVEVAINDREAWFGTKEIAFKVTGEPIVKVRWLGPYEVAIDYEPTVSNGFDVGLIKILSGVSHGVVIVYYRRIVPTREGRVERKDSGRTGRNLTDALLTP